MSTRRSVQGMTTNQSDETPGVRPFARPGPTRVEMGGRVLLDQATDAERATWTERLEHIPGKVYDLTGPEAGFPAEIERWESWHLAYVEKLAYELQQLAETAKRVIARRDGAL